jgi:hypothetical protein
MGVEEVFQIVGHSLTFFSESGIDIAIAIGL